LIQKHLRTFILYQCFFSPAGESSYLLVPIINPPFADNDRHLSGHVWGLIGEDSICDRFESYFVHQIVPFNKA